MKNPNLKVKKNMLWISHCNQENECLLISSLPIATPLKELVFIFQPFASLNICSSVQWNLKKRYLIYI